MTRGQKVFAGLFSVALAAGLAQPASATVTTIDIYGSYTDGVSGVTLGDNAPTIVNNGLVQGTPPTLSTYFNVDNLTQGGAAGDATTGGGLLFSVSPASCINSGCGSGTETATITVDFTFYNAGGTAIGTASDTALATFDYTGGGNGTDNLCWSNSGVGGTEVVSHQLVGTCGAPGTGLQTAYEQIGVDLSGSYYDVNLYDWNDWTEHPNITFQWLNTPSRVPEPASLALFGAGLLGFGGFLIIHRRRKLAARVV